VGIVIPVTTMVKQQLSSLAADFSPSLHKKDILKRKYDDGDDDDDAFSEFSPLTGDQSRGA
jgi:hypothetical protein